MFIDTHCHLSHDDYDDIDLVIKENRENKIEKIIVSACDKNSMIEALNYLDKYEDVFLTIGFHPSESASYNKDELDFLVKSLKSNKKIVGVGEIGLDYHYGKEDQLKQIEMFIDQMKVASDLNLPVVIHSRDATEDTIKILKEFPNINGVIHCFSGSVETAKIYVKMGYKIGIGGVVTFKNSKLYEVIEAVGLDNIILETDSPYLTPEPYRGKKNSSKYIPLIAEKLARILNVSVEKVSEITLNNTYCLFDLK